jgi:hypothetical protein
VLEKEVVGERDCFLVKLLDIKQRVSELYKEEEE